MDLPPGIRAVVVRRCGRLGAALGAGAPAAALVLAAAVMRSSGALPPAIVALFPGPAPAVLATLLALAWAGAAFGLLAGRLAGERLFVATLARSVSPTADAQDDIDRLERETPLVAGQRLALRMEGAATALPVIAASLLLPATLVAPLGKALFAPHGWPSVDGIEDALAAWAKPILVAAAAGFPIGLGLRADLRRAGTVSIVPALVAGALAALFIGWLGGSRLGFAFAVPLLAGAAAMRAVRRDRDHLGLAHADVAALDAPLASIAARALRWAARPLVRAARASARIAQRLLAPLVAGRARKVIVSLVVVWLAVAIVYGLGRQAGMHDRIPAVGRPITVSVPVAAAVAVPSVVAAPAPIADHHPDCVCPELN